MQVTLQMKKYIVLTIVVLLGFAIYLYFDIPHSPSEKFAPNAFPWSINKDYKHLIEEFEFVIAYEQDEGSAGWSGYKIIALRDAKWYKITIKSKNIFKPLGNHSALQSKQTEWNIDSATVFLDSLKQYHLFTLPSQTNLIQQCDSFTNVFDGGGFTVEIISGWKIRRQHYYMPYIQYENCPKVREWYYAYRIQNLFQHNW